MKGRGGGSAHIGSTRLGLTSPAMSPDQEELISRNLLALLRANLNEGQEAEVAIHPELRRVLVFVDDELVLTCGFDELLAGPGGSLN